MHEMALNPDTFEGRSDVDILSTLVHEMVHCWQEAHGHPSRQRYHNREWADRMRTIGLMPSHTGAPGGKETGQQVTHYIDPEGAFATAAAALLASGFQLSWQSTTVDEVTRRKKAASKTKYSCPNCGQNAWSKPEAKFRCDICHLPMLPVLADDADSAA